MLISARLATQNTLFCEMQMLNGTFEKKEAVGSWVLMKKMPLLVLSMVFQIVSGLIYSR